MRLRFRGLVALLWLACAAPAAGAQAETAGGHLSSDPRLVSARALVEQRRFAEALAALRPLAPGHADRTDALFLLGLAATGAAAAKADGAARGALLAEAVRAFRAILIDRPGLVRVRLELARAFFLQQEDSLAREHFERVLAGRPPPAMAANIRRFLAAIRARRRWTGSFGAMLAPDSNINNGSDREIVYIWNLPFRLDMPPESRSGIGVSAWGGAEYRLPLAERLHLRSGASAFRTEYAGRDFDRMNISALVGPRRLLDRDTALSLLATAEQDWRAGTPENRSWGLRLEGERRFGRRVRADAQAGWKQRAWRRDRDKRLDGPETDLALRVLWRATSTVQAEFAGGLDWNRPEGAPERDSDTSWWRAGVSAALPAGFTVGISGEWRRTGYDGLACCPPTLDNRPRTDRTRILRLTAFNRGWTLFGFSPQLALVRIRLETNAQAVGYERSRAELRFVRQF